MKKIKYILIIFNALFIFCISQNVKAWERCEEYGIRCKYTIVGSLDKYNYTLSLDSDNQAKLIRDDTKAIELTGEIENVQIGDDKTFTCPTLYYHFIEVSGDWREYPKINFYKGQNDMSLNPTDDSCTNDDNPNNNVEEQISCRYENTKMNSNINELEFSIVKYDSGKIETFDANSNTSFWNFDEEKFEEYEKSQFLEQQGLKCPDYLTITDAHWPSIYSYNVKPSNEVTDWKYVGGAHYADEKDVLTKYIFYSMLKANDIEIYKYKNSEYGYEAKKSKSIELDDDKMGEIIEISNWSEYKDKFDAGDYPKFLVYNNDQYAFSEEKVEGADRLYINGKYMIGIDIGGVQFEATCKSIFGSDTDENSIISILNNTVVKAIYIGVPILLILLTTLDFAKVVFVDDKDGIQNAFKKFQKRVVAAVLIYLTPTLLILFTNIIVGNDNKIEECVKILKNLSETSSETN